MFEDPILLTDYCLGPSYISHLLAKTTSAIDQMRGFHWLDSEEVPLLSPSRLVYVGLRDLDPGEKRFIRELGIKAYTMHEVDKYGIGKVSRSIEG